MARDTSVCRSFNIYIYIYFFFFGGGCVVGYGEQVKWFVGCCGGCVVVVIGLWVVVVAGLWVAVG